MVGFSKAKIDGKYLREFKKWLKNGYEADMSYMQKISERSDIDKILPDAKTVIVLGMNYYHEQPTLPHGSAHVARYAYGRDYHKVIGKKLKELEEFISTTPPMQSRNLSKKSARADFCSQKTAKESHIDLKSYVDTGPILERAFAEQSGLGRIGKNGCLITEKFGSWVFLAEIITTIDLNLNKNSKAISTSASTSRWSDPSHKPFNICGNCTRCMTACPTGAIIAPGIIDSRLCISYLTIENRKKIPQRLAKIIKKTKRIFGCDICQEVCPHNIARRRRAQKINSPPANNPQQNLLDGLLTPIAGDSLSLKKTSAITTDAEFLKIFAGSSLMRAKRKGLQRNARICKLQ